MGNEYKEVHIWLDELFGKYGFSHRQYRHNKEGVEEIRKMFGNKAAKAAELHIIADIGEIPTKDEWKKGSDWLDMWK